MSNAVTFERLQTEYYPESVGFRSKTPMFSLRMGFVFLNGGGGDYLCWMQPIRWLASEATWIVGVVFVPVYLKEIAEYFLKPYPKWTVQTYLDLKDEKIQKLNKTENLALRGPLNLQQESLNATGAHLLTCGWVYFTNKDKGPDTWDSWAGRQGWHYYPPFKQADLDQVELPELARALEPKKYVVITTGQTTESRHVPPEYWNHVIEYVREIGLTPVFLGKRVVETGNLRNIHTVYPKELRLDLGVNLLDQTTLMQAASILSRAACVVGHDNGLLHLAGCTEVPIVFGYNLASPEHRRPIRPVGKTVDINLTTKELACNNCQSNTNFVIGYSFTKCFYSDNLCISMLFENKAERWKTAITTALT